MPSIYTPSENFKEGTEKDWPVKLGSLDWDFTRIVFTKRTLIEFLRYTGTSVDPNLNNIAKLPRYADFGQLVEAGADHVPGIAKAAPVSADASAGEDAFKPTRRVRTVPGGATSFQLGDGSDDIFGAPPSKSIESLSISDADEKTAEETAEKAPEAEASEFPSNPGYKPSRRVRTGPGGPSSMANLWDDHVEPEQFKPTRRVREGPGGQDSIGQTFF